MLDDDVKIESFDGTVLVVAGKLKVKVTWEITQSKQHSTLVIKQIQVDDRVLHFHYLTI